MRRLAIVIAAVTATACTTAPPPSPEQVARTQAQLQELTAGKVAQAPISCLQHYNANDMVVIDENTVAFKNGRTVYIAHMNGPCSNLGGASYALLTKDSGSMGLCRGDIARVIDTSLHMTVGSCTFGDIIPYVSSAG